TCGGVPPSQLTSVNFGWVQPRRGRDLVRHGEYGVEPPLSGDVEVALKLACLELVLTGLNLDQSRPGALAARHSDKAIWIHGLVAVFEGHLDVGFDLALRRAERVGDGLAELANRPHDR